MPAGCRSVMITGGAGFIGAHLAGRCLARGDDVHVVTRPDTDLSRLAALADRLVIHRLPLTDSHAVRACLNHARPDTIFHLAANTRRPRRPDIGDAVATLGSDLGDLLSLVSAAAAMAQPPRALIRTGSLAEYGPARAPYVESQRENPVTPYAAALVTGTHYLRMLQPQLPFAAATARLALVYGSGQRGEFLIPQLIRNSLMGERIILRRPKDRRDLLHVDEAVAGLLRIADAPCLAGAVVNLSTGEAPTVAEIASAVVEAAGADPGLITIAPAEGPADGDVGIPDFRGATDLARLSFGWHATLGFREGIARTVAAARKVVENAPC